MYGPEGISNDRYKNYRLSDITQAMHSKEIIEARAYKCDDSLNLYIDLGSEIYGVIPYWEAEYSLTGEATKSIAVRSKVGKFVDFLVKEIKLDENGKKFAELSRKDAQQLCKENYIDKLENGQIIDAKICHIENYGIFCDIGCGITALLPLENLCTARVNNPRAALRDIKMLKVIVKSRDNKDRITLTHKELLGTWEEETERFSIGETVVGIVTVTENYGEFVQLTPNLSGLAEVYEGSKAGDKVSVYIKDILPDKMKVKLIILDSSEDNSVDKLKFDYKKTEGKVDYWRYSPSSYYRAVETKFN